MKNPFKSRLRIIEGVSEIEDMLLPLNSGVIIGIDVYGIDYNVNPHVYPLYFSSSVDSVKIQ